MAGNISLMQNDIVSTPDQDVVAICRRHAALISLVCSAVIALLVWRIGGSWALPAFLYLAVAGTVLAIVDAFTLRLPDRIVVPSYVVGAALLGVSAVVDDGGGAMVRAVLGMAIAFAGYLVLALINPSGLGFGDVKLAGLLGLYLAWAGWQTLFWGLAAGFFLAALTGTALLVARRSNRKAALPFGPFMLAGALLALLLWQR